MLMNLNEKEKQYVYNTVMIKHNKKYGKHLVASRDIQLGELVIVEKFYATCLNANKTFTCYHHCYNVCWSGVLIKAIKEAGSISELRAQLKAIDSKRIEI